MRYRHSPSTSLIAAFIASLWLPLAAPAQQEPAEENAEDGTEPAEGDEPAIATNPTYPIPRHDISVPLEPGVIEPGADPVQVIVCIVISAEGLVTEAEVSASSGIQGIDAAALRAANLMTFLPATLEGEAVEVTIEYPIVFLAPEPPPPAVLPAELRGRVEERGSMKPIEAAEVSLFAAIFVGDDETETETESETEAEAEAEADPGDKEPGSRGALDGRQETAAEIRNDGVVRHTGDRADQAVPAGASDVDRAPGAGRESGFGGGLPFDPATVSPDEFFLAPEPTVTAYTDADGNFELLDIPPGIYVVACGYAGFRVEKYVEVLPEGTVRDVIYRIRPNAVLQTVVIARKDSDTPERVLSGEQLKTIPGAGRDPMAAVASLPGVVHTPPSFSASEMVQTPVLRGAAGEDSVMYLDGLPTPIIFHTMSTFSITGDSIIERAFLKPAAVEASYGDLIGGVVGLDLRSPRKDRIGGVFDPGIGLFAFNLEGPIREKSRFHVGIRRSYYDILMKLILPKDLPLDFVTAPFFQDQQVIIEADITPWMTWNLGYIGTMDGMKMLFEDEDDEGDIQEQMEFVMQTDLHRIFLKIDMESRSGFTNRLHPALTFWSYEFTFGNFFGSTDRHTTFHLKDDLHLPVTRWLALDAGGILEVDKLEQYRNVPQQSPESAGSYGGDPTEDNLVGTVDEKRTWLGAYISAPITPVKQLTLAPEFRIDYFGKIHAAIPQIRGRIGVQPHERFRVSLAGGRYIQSPSYEELSDTTGNTDLRSEGAWHVNLGAAWAPGPWLDLDVQGYVKWLDNQVVSSIASSAGGWGDLGGFEDMLGEGDDPTHGLSNEGIGRIYGMEAFVRFDLARKVRFSGWIGYGLSWAERKDFPDEDWHWFQFDRRHQLTVLAQVTFPKEVILGARFQLQSGSPQTAVVDSTYYPDIGFYIPEYGELYGERGLPFVQLDLRIDKRWRKKNHIVDFYVDLQNITMAKSSDFVLYSFDYRESASFMSFPAINLALRIEF